MKKLLAITALAMLVLSIAPYSALNAAKRDNAPAKKAEKKAAKKAKAPASKDLDSAKTMVGMEGREKKLVQPRKEVLDLLRGKERISAPVNLVEPGLSAKDAAAKVSSWTMPPGYGWNCSLYIDLHDDAHLPNYRNVFFEPIGGKTIYRTIVGRQDLSREEVLRAKEHFETKHQTFGGPTGYLPNFESRLRGEVVLPFPKVDCDYFVYDSLTDPTIRGVTSPAEGSFYYDITGPDYASAGHEEIIVRDVAGEPVAGALVLSRSHLESITDAEGKATIVRSTRDADGHKNFPDQIKVRAKGYFPHAVQFNESAPRVNRLKAGKRIPKSSKKGRPAGVPFGECTLAVKYIRAKFTLDEEINDWHLGFRPPERVRGAAMKRARKIKVDDSHVVWPKWAPKQWKQARTSGRSSLFFAESISVSPLAVPYPAPNGWGNTSWSLAGHRAMTHVISEGKLNDIKTAAERADADVRYDFESVFRRGPDPDGKYRVRLPMVAGTYLIPGSKPTGAVHSSPSEGGAAFLSATLSSQVLKTATGLDAGIPDIELKLVDIKKKYKVIHGDERYDHGDGWIWYHYDVAPRWGGRSPGAPQKKPTPSNWPKK